MSARRAGEPTGWRGRGGFTLLEVAVVITIAIIVLAITVPSFSSMRRRNELSTCALNLKTIGTALLMHREDWMGFPPDRTEAIGRSYQGQDIRGPGLFYLYYVYRRDPGEPFTDTNGNGKYDPQEPYTDTDGNGSHDTGEPYVDVNKNGEWDAAEPYKDLNGNGKRESFLWWSNVRADYGVRRVEILHCPANPVARPQFATPGASLPDPTLGGYNNYDYYYRRSWGAAVNRPGQGSRDLKQPFPPDETVVTWCPYHRNAPPRPPQPPDYLPQPGNVVPGEIDLVLFADGVVERVRIGPLTDEQWEPAYARELGLVPPPRAQDTEDFKAEHIF
jgi:type II secretory pathway pseudopilin PulG